jgi:hypothetical protein
VPVEAIAATGAVPANHAPFVKAYFAVRHANAQPTAFIYSERTAETVAGFEDATGQPLNPPRAIAEIPHLSTNQVPDTSTSGPRPTSRPTCSPATSGSSGSACARSWGSASSATGSRTTWP